MVSKKRRTPLLPWHDVQLASSDPPGVCAGIRSPGACREVALVPGLGLASTADATTLFLCLLTSSSDSDDMGLDHVLLRNFEDQGLPCAHPTSDL